MAEIKVNAEEFKKLYMELTNKELAEKLGVKPNQVSKIAKQLGLSKPRGLNKDRNILVVEE